MESSANLKKEPGSVEPLRAELWPFKEGNPKIGAKMTYFVTICTALVPLKASYSWTEWVTVTGFSLILFSFFGYFYSTQINGALVWNPESLAIWIRIGLHIYLTSTSKLTRKEGKFRFKTLDSGLSLMNKQ